MIFPLSLTANLPILFNLFSYSLKQKFLLTYNLITQRSWSSEDQLLLAWQSLHFINMTQNSFLSPHAVGFLPLAIMVFIFIYLFFYFSGTLRQRKIHSHLKESLGERKAESAFGDLWAVRVKRLKNGLLNQ